MKAVLTRTGQGLLGKPMVRMCTLGQCCPNYLTVPWPAARLRRTNRLPFTCTMLVVLYTGLILAAMKLRPVACLSCLLRETPLLQQPRPNDVLASWG